MVDEATKRDRVSATPEREAVDEYDEGVVKVDLHKEAMKLANSLKLTTEDLKRHVEVVHYSYLKELARQYWTGHGRGYDRGALDAAKVLPTRRQIITLLAFAFAAGLATVPIIRMCVGACHLLHRLNQMAG